MPGIYRAPGRQRNTWPGSIKDSLGLSLSPGIYRALDLILFVERWWIWPCHGGCCDVCTISSREELCVYMFSFILSLCLHCVLHLFMFCHTSVCVYITELVPSFFPSFPLFLSTSIYIYHASPPNLTFPTSLREVYALFTQAPLINKTSHTNGLSNLKLPRISPQVPASQRYRRSGRSSDVIVVRPWGRQTKGSVENVCWFL